MATRPIASVSDWVQQGPPSADDLTRLATDLSREPTFMPAVTGQGDALAEWAEQHRGSVPAQVAAHAAGLGVGALREVKEHPIASVGVPLAIDVGADLAAAAGLASLGPLAALGLLAYGGYQAWRHRGEIGQAVSDFFKPGAAGVEASERIGAQLPYFLPASRAPGLRWTRSAAREAVQALRPVTPVELTEKYARPAVVESLRNLEQHIRTNPRLGLQMAGITERAGVSAPGAVSSAERTLNRLVSLYQNTEQARGPLAVTEALRALHIDPETFRSTLGPAEEHQWRQELAALSQSTGVPLEQLADLRARLLELGRALPVGPLRSGHLWTNLAHTLTRAYEQPLTALGSAAGLLAGHSMHGYGGAFIGGLAGRAVGRVLDAPLARARFLREIEPALSLPDRLPPVGARGPEPGVPTTAPTAPVEQTAPAAPAETAPPAGAPTETAPAGARVPTAEPAVPAAPTAEEAATRRLLIGTAATADPKLSAARSVLFSPWWDATRTRLQNAFQQLGMRPESEPQGAVGFLRAERGGRWNAMAAVDVRGTGEDADRLIRAAIPHGQQAIEWVERPEGRQAAVIVSRPYNPANLVRAAARRAEGLRAAAVLPNGDLMLLFDDVGEAERFDPHKLLGGQLLRADTSEPVTWEVKRGAFRVIEGTGGTEAAPDTGRTYTVLAVREPGIGKREFSSFAEQLGRGVPATHYHPQQGAQAAFVHTLTGDESTNDIVNAYRRKGIRVAVFRSVPGGEDYIYQLQNTPETRAALLARGIRFTEAGDRLYVLDKNGTAFEAVQQLRPIETVDGKIHFIGPGGGPQPLPSRWYGPEQSVEEEARPAATPALTTVDRRRVSEFIGQHMQDINSLLGGEQGLKSALDWYRRWWPDLEPKLAELVGRPLTDRDRQLMALLIALHSPQAPIDRNLQEAMAHMAGFVQSGRFWETNPLSEGGQKMWGSGTAAIGPAVRKLNRLLDERGLGGMLDWLIREHPVDELKEYGLPEDVRAFFGGREHMPARLPGAFILGPKRGAFFMNLTGNYDWVTMDTWAYRAVLRFAQYAGVIPKDEDLNQYRVFSSEGVKDLPPALRRMSQDFYRVAAQELSDRLGQKVSPADAQAALWVYERQRWARQMAESGQRYRLPKYETYAQAFETVPERIRRAFVESMRSGNLDKLLAVAKEAPLSERVPIQFARPEVANKYLPLLRALLDKITPAMAKEGFWDLLLQYVSPSEGAPLRLKGILVAPLGGGINAEAFSVPRDLPYKPSPDDLDEWSAAISIPLKSVKEAYVNFLEGLRPGEGAIIISESMLDRLAEVAKEVKKLFPKETDWAHAAVSALPDGLLRSRLRRIVATTLEEFIHLFNKTQVIRTQLANGTWVRLRGPETNERWFINHLPHIIVMESAEMLSELLKDDPAARSLRDNRFDTLEELLTKFVREVVLGIKPGRSIQKYMREVFSEYPPEFRRLLGLLALIASTVYTLHWGLYGSNQGETT